MYQSGLLIPCSIRSTPGIFNQFLLDVGDSQSIEYELSTYSSRLKHMRNFMNLANRNTLFLIDEFGSGTDPELGGAIAEAVLEVLVDTKAYGVITTHYSRIKLLSESTKGLLNASMLFNERTLAPKYQLVLGQPGSSYTFEVAELVGLPKEVIKRAKQKTKGSNALLETVISKYRDKAQMLDAELKNLHQKEQERKNAIEKAHSEVVALKEKEKKWQAEHSENEKLLRSGRIFEALLAASKKSKNKKEVLQHFLKAEEQLRKREIEKLTKKKESLQKKIKKQPLLKPIDVVVGQKVSLESFKQKGIVTAIDRGKATVEIGNMKYIVDLKKLREPS